MSNKFVRIAQITDMHLFADPAVSLMGVNTQQSFSAVLKILTQDLIPPDLIILTGDLSQDGKIPSYQRIADELNQFNAPVYFVPGNHDNLETISQCYPQGCIKNDKHIILDHWQLILLNSHQSGKVPGRLSDSELQFLADCLYSYPSHPALIAVHHNPVKIGSAWLDQLGIENAEAFWQIIAMHPCVKGIIFGHVHQQSFGQYHSVSYFSTPSTCIQFKKHAKQFCLEELPPGYRWINLYQDGLIKTNICRIPHYIGIFNDKASGY